MHVHPGGLSATAECLMCVLLTLHGLYVELDIMQLYSPVTVGGPNPRGVCCRKKWIKIGL